ncbi:MAG: long-chain fatty acid--CoA ligase [Cyanobacteria bacterium SW_9_44_58]|nr:MAG: long-chain fatty acid--CoA ligase [Cyanobacteria bacterium SW_9_44_58]
MLQQTNAPLNYSTASSLPELWSKLAAHYADYIALDDPHQNPPVKITYQQLNQKIQQFAAGLQAQGIEPDTKIALFADNSPRWFIADQGIMTAGAVNVVRSAQADAAELLYIFTDSDSTVLVVEDKKTLDRLNDQFGDLSIELIVLLSDESVELPERTVFNFSQLMALGKEQQLQSVPRQKNDLATLIYTSGTTGKPKGAMLSHGNFLHQVRAIGDVIQPQPGEQVLSILPSWHAYERAAEYFLLSRGCHLIYTNLRSFKKDLREQQPHYMVGVPRLWESVYDGIQKQLNDQTGSKKKLIDFFLNVSERYIKARRVSQGLSLDNLNPSFLEKSRASVQQSLLQPLHHLADRIVYQTVRQGTGGNLKVVISGGGSLAKHIDDFYEMIGITLLVGYGLTETSPVTHARRQHHNLRGSAGQALPETETKIVDPETKQSLSDGEKGLVMIRGNQLMQGYYKQPEATQKAIDQQGWFNTGDLGWITPTGDLVLTGRAKDTIVLSNGENIEPQPLEDACLRSPYIDQIMVVGQDQRCLGALIVPNIEALQNWSQQNNLNLDFSEAGLQQTLEQASVQNLFREELNREVKNRPGYRPDDRIGVFKLILAPFSVENGMMTQTLKIKRPVVTERYQDMIDGMFAKG